MKKVLSVLAVSAFVLTANAALAGGPGKKSMDGCPAACQQQIDDLNSSQAQQNEQLGAHGKQLQNHEGRITTLEKNAYNPWYVRAGARATWESVSLGGVRDKGTDVGWGGALAFGRQFGQFRTELELAHQAADLSKFTVAPGVNVTGGTESLETVMVNGYYEIPVYDAFAVYGMVGLGYARENLQANTNVAGTSFSPAGENTLAYKAGVGATYNFTENWAGDLGYEYLAAAANDFNTHNIVASVRFKF